MVYICQHQTPNPKPPPSSLSLNNHKYDLYDSESVSISQISSFVSYFRFHISSVQLVSCVQLFATPWTAACQVCLSLTITWSLPKFMLIALVMPSSHLILWHPPILLPSIFPSIRDYSNESSVHIRWPKYWSFSFTISPSSEYSGFICLKIDWFDLLAV